MVENSLSAPTHGRRKRGPYSGRAEAGPYRAVHRIKRKAEHMVNY